MNRAAGQEMKFKNAAVGRFTERGLRLRVGVSAPIIVSSGSRMFPVTGISKGGNYICLLREIPGLYSFFYGIFFLPVLVSVPVFWGHRKRPAPLQLAIDILPKLDVFKTTPPFAHVIYRTAIISLHSILPPEAR
jgi:hypothetical protein